jgi:CubicO group peptidase (beta-lactamase class C family)
MQIPAAPTQYDPAVPGSLALIALMSSSLPPSLERTFKELAAFYESGLREHHIVGSSLLVVKGDQVLFRSTYGLANVEEKRPVAEGTIFHWASITKTFTSIAFMQLEERGLVDLDDPVAKYVPEIRGVHDPFGDTSEITLRHLMSHSAGFRDPTWPWGGDEDWHPFEPLHWEQLVAMFPYTEILFRPGSRYRYSNPGILFLGRVIELLTTDDYEVYVDKNVLKPLGMHRSYFDVTPYHLQKDKARGYYFHDGELKAARAETNTGVTVSNGGLNASLEDMARYLAFLIGDGTKAGYEGVLRRASLERLWRPVVEVSRADGRHEDMGLSFFIEEANGSRFVGHHGEQNGFLSHFYVEPRSGTAYIVAYNTDASTKKGPGPDTRVLDRALADYFFKHVFPRFPTRPAPR